ncbi:MAG TPA: MBL fold metallo-hydrolase [Gaiellaceae bacterium]|nr:MBL fold metallo-hydrolase [Gaiellaceae bacterium]
MADLHIHRHASGPPVHVNAYLVETAEGVVAVDGTLTVSDGRALRARLGELGQPLLAVLVTHTHPDHYGGIVELVSTDDIPIFATAGVEAAIRRDDAVKEQILRPMFGDEWPRERVFPNAIVSDGDTLELGGARFSVVDLGPGESPHDSVWLLGDDRRTVFLGDQVYDRMHAYLADGFHDRWLANLELLEAQLPPDATLYNGHGGPVTPADFAWQRRYIETFVDAVRSVDWDQPEAAKTIVVQRLTALLPSDDLRFLMELSVEPVAAGLGLTTAR